MSETVISIKDLSKSFGVHKGDGFVRICCFAFSLAAAAGGQRCRGGCNAANLQKRAAGDLFYHINILSSHFRKAVLRKCRSAVLP